MKITVQRQSPRSSFSLLILLISLGMCFCSIYQTMLDANIPLQLVYILDEKAFNWHVVQH